MATVTTAKLSIDTVTRIISVISTPVLVGNEYVVELDIQIDLYSDLKEVWLANEDLRKLRFPLRAVGGDPLPGSKVLGDTYFLRSDWKIRVYEGNHRFAVNGNFYSEDGTSPFIPPIGSYTVFMEHQVSNLVDSTVAQLPEIEYGAFNGAVHVDQTNSTGSAITGTDYPSGTPRFPCLNISDAASIAVSRGFDTIHVLGNLNILTENVDGFKIVGQSATKTIIYVASAASVIGCEFSDCVLTGTLDGGSQVFRSAVSNLVYVDGGITECFLQDIIYMSDGIVTLNIINCVSGIPGPNPVIIDMTSSTAGLSIRNYSGGIKLQNRTNPGDVSIDVSQGSVTIDSTCTEGVYVCRGVGSLTNNSTGNAIVYEQMLDPKYVNISLYADAAVHIDTVNGTAGTLFPKGTITNPVNNIADARIIADSLGLTRYNFSGTIVLTSGNYDNWTITGVNSILTDVVVFAGATTNTIKLEECTVTGTLTGGNQQLVGCFTTNVSGLNGLIINGAFGDTITLSSTGQLLGQQVSVANNVAVNVNSCPLMQLQLASSGNITISGVDAGSIVQVSLLGMGTITLDNTNTSGGVISVSGAGNIVNNSTATVIDTTYSVRVKDVWDQDTANHVIADTFGALMQDIYVDTTDLRVDSVTIIDLVTLLLKYESNRTKIDKVAKTLTVYDNNGITPIKVFNLKDSTGTPSVTEVTERVPQ